MLYQLHTDVYGHSTDLYAYCYVELWSVGISFSWASVLFALSTRSNRPKNIFGWLWKLVQTWIKHRMIWIKQYNQNDREKQKSFFMVSISYGYLHGWILTHLVRSTATSWWLESGSVGLRLFCHLQKLSSVLSAWWFIINPSSFSCNIKNHNCHF